MTPFTDVRMRGFGERAEAAVVLRLLEQRLATLSSEAVPLAQSAGRVLARGVVAAVNVPGFKRAAMDGFALHAIDTKDATESQPILLQLVGQSLPARPFTGVLAPGQAVRITTGAPVPSGADAVVPVEAASENSTGRVLVQQAVALGRHVAQVGEDVTKGSEVIPTGRRLRPQDVGLLASIGVGTVTVVRRPQVALLVTGDELLPPGSLPDAYRIMDSNSPMLAALIDRDGGECRPVQYLPDRYELVRDAIQSAAADVIFVSGGSSVGPEDHAPRAVAELGELPVHGVAIRPASPLGIGFVADGRVPIVLLPGNPVSCLCAYDVFAGRVVRRLGGRSWELPYRQVTLPLVQRIESVLGRVDYVRVRLTPNGVEPIATSGASILSSTVIADGFLLVDHNRDVLGVGESVEVWLYD